MLLFLKQEFKDMFDFISKLNRTLKIVVPGGITTGFFCPRPFYNISIHTGGSVYPCCPNWVKFEIGKLRSPGQLMKLWNSSIFSSYRKNMLKTSIGSVCRNDRCPFLLNNDLPTRLNSNKIDKYVPDLFPEWVMNDQDIMNALQNESTFLDYKPKSLDICIDERCNLYCTICRKERIVNLTPSQERVLETVKQIIHEIGPSLRFINLANGEAFFSPFSLGLLKSMKKSEFPLLEIDTVTNGQLLTPLIWNTLGEGKEFIRSIDVSVDAASEATYNKIRRGGSWSKLLDNLQFISSLRQNKKITRFTMSFVITADNFREMLKFISLARDLKADRIIFIDLKPIKGMELDYISSAVHLKGHPFYKEFLEIIKLPEFDDSGVLLGSIARAHDL